MQQNNHRKTGQPAVKTTSRQVFTFTGSSAKTVQLVGDFTDWQKEPIALHKDPGGVWRAAVELKPGPHRYRFLVDGQWQNDPACPTQVPNPYGTQDSLREVA